MSKAYRVTYPEKGFFPRNNNMTSIFGSNLPRRTKQRSEVNHCTLHWLPLIPFHYKVCEWGKHQISTNIGLQGFIWKIVLIGTHKNHVMQDISLTDILGGVPYTPLLNTYLTPIFHIYLHLNTHCRKAAAAPPVGGGRRAPTNWKATPTCSVCQFFPFF